MRSVLLFIFVLSLIPESYGQVSADEKQTCQCTVERSSGDREQGSLKVTVTAQPLDQFGLAINDELGLRREETFGLYREFAFERELAYPYLYLTHQQQTYTLDMEVGRLYAGPVIIGKAHNATEAFEVLVTQVLLPQKCTETLVDFKSTPDRQREILAPTLLPGNFYN